MKPHSDPPTIQRKDIPQVLLILAGTLVGMAIIAAWMQAHFFQNHAYWKVFVWFFLAIVTAQVIFYFVVRPLRGMPPLFRRRPEDDFETWLVGNGMRLHRLRERYSTDELIRLFGLIAVLCIAAFLWSVRM